MSAACSRHKGKDGVVRCIIIAQQRKPTCRFLTGTQKAKCQSFTVPASSLFAVLQLEVCHHRSQSVVYAHRYNGDRMLCGQLFGHGGDITTVYHGHLHEGHPAKSTQDFHGDKREW